MKVILGLIMLLFCQLIQAQRGGGLVPLNDPSIQVPSVFEVGSRDNKNICQNSQGGSISSIKLRLRREGLNINSSSFWSIKCEKLNARMTTQPNLLQVAIWKNNLGLIKQMIRELDGVKDLNFVIINELGNKETPYDWLNRQIIAADSAVKVRLKGIKGNIVDRFNAKPIGALL